MCLLLDQASCFRLKFESFLSFCFLFLRRAGEESDSSDFKDSSSSEGSSSSESERDPKEQMISTASMDQKEHPEDSSSSDDDGDEPLRSSQSRLIFEYLERDLPYIREPFADKVCLYINTEYQVIKACGQVI